MEIQLINARYILDSRGFPTVEADVQLSGGAFGRAAVPSGASTGSREALELRDADEGAFHGKGVTKAVTNVLEHIAPALQGMDASDQAGIDAAMQDIDGTQDKSKLGANAILAVSLATAKACAAAKGLPLFRYVAELSGVEGSSLPTPMMNIINGGKHADNSTDIQEFMIIPRRGETFSEKLRTGAEIFHSLKKELSSRGYATTVGDEGGYAPSFKHGNQEALEVIAAAVQASGYSLGTDVVLALDVAATELLDDQGNYVLHTENKTLTAEEMTAWYKQLQQSFPIESIEDGLSEDDWAGWETLTKELGHTTQLVGDDLLVTNTALLQRAIETRAANAILIKPNQIGTLTETINAVMLAKQYGWGTIISHRSGETEDTTIAHLAVGLDAGQIKTGSLSRSERLAKYNELLRIEEQL